MRFRSKRPDDPAKRAEQRLETVTVGRVREATDGAAAVIGALALYEVRRPVRRLAVADLGEGALAEDVQRILAGRRETVFGEAATLALDGIDGVVAVAPGVLPAADVLEHVERFGDLLVGVLVVDADAPAPAQLAPPPPQQRDPDLARRLAELSARESALRRVAEAVQKGHGDVPPGVAPEELAAMTLRAERAEARVAELEAQLAAAVSRPAPPPPAAAAPAPAAPPPPPAAPAPPAPPVARAARPTLAQLEALVNDAYTRGDPAAEEWSVYVPLLREHAEPDGTLPAQFDALIEQVFGGALRR